MGHGLKQTEFWCCDHWPVEKWYVDERENLGNELSDEKRGYLQAHYIAQNRRKKALKNLKL